MKAIIVLLTLVATSVNGLLYDVNEKKFMNINSNRTNPLIIGGYPAPVRFAPYHASLRLASGEHFCDGSILNSRWLLTGANCIYNDNPIVFAVVGTNKLDYGGIIYDIKIRVKHSGFDPYTLEHDIALLKTWHDIAFSAFVKPIRLPDRDVIGWEVVTITGWGRIFPLSNVLPNDLQFTNVDVLHDNDCRARMLIGDIIFPTNFCTYRPGTGICFRDSGAPLVIQGVQYGIASWSKFADGIPCNKRFPDVATRVFRYGSWIWWTQHWNKWS